MQFHIVGRHVRARGGERAGIILLQEGDKALADQATEIECRGGVVGAHDGAKLHGAFGEIGDLQGGSAAVPELGVLENAVKFFTDGRDWERVIHVEEDGADDFGGGAGPVLKRALDEVSERNDESAEIPETHDDVGGFNFFNPAPFAFDDDGVVYADRLRECDLQSGNNAGESGTRGHADYEASDAGGSKDASAELASVGKSHEHRREGDDNDHDDGDATDDLSLRVNAASVEIVFNFHGVTESEQAGDDLDRDDEGPTDGGDQANIESSFDERSGALGERSEGNSGGKGHERKNVTSRSFCVLEEKTRQAAALAADEALQEPKEQKLREQAERDGAGQHGGAEDGDANILPGVRNKSDG